MLGSIEPVSHDYVSVHTQGRIAMVTFDRGNPLNARRRPRPYAASMAFSRCSHSSSSTTSKRMTLPRIAGASSAQSFLDACSVQISNTEGL